MTEIILKRWVGSILALALALSGPSAVWAAAPKAGSTCSPKGKVAVVAGRKYTCIKIGAKLFWSKPISVKTSTPTPTATPLTPLAMELNKYPYRELNQKALAPEFIEESTAANTRWRVLKTAFEKHLTWFDQIGLSRSKKLFVVVPTTSDWVNQTLKTLGCTTQIPGINNAYAIWEDCKGASVVTTFGLSFQPNNSGLTLDDQHVIIHETFHQWNREVIQPGQGNADYPKWLHEGGASAFARYAYYEVSDKSVSPDQLLTNWFTLQRPDLRQACVGVKIREMIPNTPWPDRANCAYSKGQIASDLILENFGLQKLIQLYKEPKAPGMASFGAVFKNITGMEIENFYDIVDLEFSKRGWS